MPALHKKAILVALFVGTILNLINQYPQLTSGASPNWLQITITYMVPYFVSFFSAKMANNGANVTDNEQEKIEPSNKTNIHQHIVADIAGQAQQMSMSAKRVNQHISLKEQVVDATLGDVQAMMSQSQSLLDLTQASSKNGHVAKHHFMLLEQQHEKLIIECKERERWAKGMLQAIQTFTEHCDHIETMAKMMTAIPSQKELGDLNVAIAPSKESEVPREFTTDDVKRDVDQVAEDSNLLIPLVATLSDAHNVLMEKVNDFPKSHHLLLSQQDNNLAMQSLNVLLDNMLQMDERTKEQSLLLDSMATKVSRLSDETKAVLAESQHNLALSEDISLQLSQMR